MEVEETLAAAATTVVEAGANTVLVVVEATAVVALAAVREGIIGMETDISASVPEASR